MLSREGSIMTRKDAIFRTTAISMVKPCRKFLCFCQRARVTKSMTRIMIWNARLICESVGAFIGSLVFNHDVCR